MRSEVRGQIAEVRMGETETSFGSIRKWSYAVEGVNYFARADSLVPVLPERSVRL